MEVFNFEQGTPQWHDIRRGVITGTRLKSAIGSPAVRKTLILELLGEAMADRDEDDRKASSYGMEHGNVAEGIVKQEYCRDPIVEVGFIKKFDWLGISPDGLVETDGKYKKAYEVKSPQAKNWVKYALDGGIPEEYEGQVLQYFIVIDDLEELEFVIFNEHIKIKELRVRRIVVTREQLKDKIEKAMSELTKFKTEWDTAKAQLKTALSI